MNLESIFNLTALLVLLCGYLIGSIPFALVIGKLFYNTDVRNHGSGNLGGSNTGRVLGKKAGISVMILDTAKASIAILITNAFYPDLSLFAGFGAIIGHCYPIFANFKGGKAVSVCFGFLLITNFYLFLISLVLLLIFLKLFKMISLSSITTFSLAPLFAYFIFNDTALSIILIFIALFIIYRHRQNIQRIINGSENKISWM